jgi:hypothetical protein
MWWQALVLAVLMKVVLINVYTQKEADQII